MKTEKSLITIAAGLAGCVLIVWLSTSLRGGEKTYEVRPQITTPEYRTDAARAIDAYERLMDRYMDLTGNNLAGIGADVQDIGRKLDSIDAKLTELSARISGIEKALGLGQVGQPAEKKTGSGEGKP